MYYSRVAATFARVFPDIGAPLVKRLRGAFHFHAKRKDQSSYRLAHKLRNVKYLAELTKFRVAPPIVAFGCLRQLLGDFQHHNIEVAATLLEGCGRFLYRQPETHSRCKELLDIMMRLKNAKNVDESIGYMVENACVPLSQLRTFGSRLTVHVLRTSVRSSDFTHSSSPPFPLSATGAASRTRRQRRSLLKSFRRCIVSSRRSLRRNRRVRGGGGGRRARWSALRRFSAACRGATKSAVARPLSRTPCSR